MNKLKPQMRTFQAHGDHSTTAFHLPGDAMPLPCGDGQVGGYKSNIQNLVGKYTWLKMVN